jgi:hypothetical protein
MFPYSAKKNSAKAIAEYSMLYPATISASDSGKSNGVRFVSAKIAIPKIKATGNIGKTYHTIDCPAMIIIKFDVPANKISVSKISEKKTSYEIICELERKAPMKAYFEFELQPDKMIA